MVAVIHFFRVYIEQMFDSSYLLIPAAFLEDVEAVYLFNHSNCGHPSICIVPFSFVLLLAVTRGTIHCHLLSLVVIRCHSLYHSSVFLWKIDSIIKSAQKCFLEIAVHKFRKCKRETCSFSKTFEEGHIWWTCLAKLRAYNLQIY